MLIKTKTEIVYDWKLQGTNKDETIEDFHLFCLSIARDLVKNKFKSNEEGELLYSDVIYRKRRTVFNLNKLYDTIFKTKLLKQYYASKNK